MDKTRKLIGKINQSEAESIEPVVERLNGLEELLMIVTNKELSMKVENYNEFCRRMEEYTSTHILPEQQEPIIEIEAEISFADITDQFFNILRHLEPFGPGNPRPIFLTRGVCNYRYTRRVGKQHEHLKLDLTDKQSVLSGIAFGKAELESDLLNGKNADVCYTLNQNTFNGVTSIQMMAQDIRICNI